jgi:LEA14-like dessication related protein
MMSLAQQVMAGSLPTTLSVGIKATNNQSRAAGISVLGWELYMKDQKYGAGMINDAVSISPNSSTVFPVSVEFDILNIVTSSNIQQILDIVFDVDNKDKLNELELSLQLKPYYKVGTQVQEYPGIITIQP